jgi:hypothetical protein
MSFFRPASASSSSSLVAQTTIDVVLMLDISASMEAQLNTAKTRLEELPIAIAQSDPQARVRVAVVAFSDYKDDVNFEAHKTDPNYWLENNDTAACKVCEFTEVQTATHFLKQLSILNGQDYPEAIELALYKVKRLKWTEATPGNRIIRLVILVTDSAPHATLIRWTDYFATVDKVPSQLNYLEQADDIRKLGAEIHVLECFLKQSPEEIHKINLSLAGKTGSVMALNNAADLMTNVTKVVKQVDAIDDLIGQFMSTKISDPSTAVQAVATTLGVTADTAVAKIMSHQSRYQKTVTAAATATATAASDDQMDCETTTEALKSMTLTG